MYKCMSNMQEKKRKTFYRLQLGLSYTFPRSDRYTANKAKMNAN